MRGSASNFHFFARSPREGRSAPQAFNDWGECSDGLVDVVVGVLLAQAEAKTGAGLLAGETHGHEDAGGIGFAGGAGRTTRGDDTGLVECENKAVAANMLEEDVAGVGHAWRVVAIDETGYDDVKQLFINPKKCTSCGSCIAACESGAIFAIEDLPEELSHFAEINAAYYKK